MTTNTVGGTEASPSSKRSKGETRACWVLTGKILRPAAWRACACSLPKDAPSVVLRGRWRLWASTFARRHGGCQTTQACIALGAWELVRLQEMNGVTKPVKISHRRESLPTSASISSGPPAGSTDSGERQVCSRESAKACPSSCALRGRGEPAAPPARDRCARCEASICLGRLG